VLRPPAGAAAGTLSVPGAGRPPEETTKALEIRRRQEVERSLPELAPLPPTRRYSLAVILGASAGQIFPVVQSRIILGRGVNCDLQLQDSEVSRRHAMIEIKGETGTITDLGSTNGTYVDGVRIQQKAIEPHQEFSLGTTTLMFIVTELGEGA